MILSTKKIINNQKKTYHNKKYVKSSGSLSIHWCSIKNQNRNLRNLKTKKIFQKSFLPVTYISSHYFQKEKKCTADCSLHLWKKSKTYLLKKERFQKKYFHLCFFVFFLSNHHTTKQKYFLVSCRNKNL